MILRFRTLRLGISALYVVLFLTVVSVAAQEAGDNSRPEPAAKAKTGEDGMTAVAARTAVSINATGEKKNASETTGEAAALGTQGSSDKWEFMVAPYLWLAGLNGTIGVGDITTDIDPGVSDILNALNFGFMATFEARKNKFILINDLMYISLEKTKDTTGPLFSSLTANEKVFVLSPVAGYRLVEGKGSSLDAIAGIRFWHTSTRLELAPNQSAGRVAESSKNWADVIGGLRGQVHVSRLFSLVGRGDLGGGGSDFTYQLFGGVGIDVSEKVSLFGGYRYLYFKYTRGDSLFDGALNGVVLGAAFRF
ncbi:MAG TPA: hypothetical protein VLG74_08060 [Blastocatellia bacterium]|nr:hypothetical protein [Blastocatellia bacterium]